MTADLVARLRAQWADWADRLARGVDYPTTREPFAKLADDLREAAAYIELMSAPVGDDYLPELLSWLDKAHVLSMYDEHSIYLGDYSPKELARCLRSLHRSAQQAKQDREDAERFAVTLAVARCPNNACDNAGTICVETRNGPQPEQCEWCFYRDQAKAYVVARQSSAGSEDA